MRNSAAASHHHTVLSRTAEHALRALLVLAQANGQARTAHRVANEIGAPENYLSKTLGRLVRSGLVRSSRGPSGGFVLAVPADAITIASIADLFAETVTRSRCMLGAQMCDAAHPCAAHRRWVALVAAARAPFTATTVANLLADDPVAATRSITNAKHTGNAGIHSGE